MRAQDLVDEREETHGPFKVTAKLSQKAKEVFRSDKKRWKKLSYVEKESIEYMIGKMARMVASGNKSQDHAIDISGYACLVTKDKKRKNKKK